MIVTLRTERIRTLADLRAFLLGREAADITLHDRREELGGWKTTQDGPVLPAGRRGSALKGS